MNFYNEWDPYAADWLENLIAAGHIPEGKVERKSISEITPIEVAGATQVHLFAGIAGWPLAFRLAGWPSRRSVWSGSCPCQPYSVAGKRLGSADERDQWPHFRRLITLGQPTVVFGEQVASPAGREWFAGVRADLEALGYEVGCADLCAASASAPHIRQRLYWVAISRPQQKGGGIFGSGEGSVEDCGRPSDQSGGPGGSYGLGYSFQPRLEGFAGNGDGRDESGRIDSDASGPATAASGNDYWNDFDLAYSIDGKVRRIEPGTFPLASGVPARVGRLRAYGNAVCVPLAAEFIKAFMEIQNVS